MRPNLSQNQCCWYKGNTGEILPGARYLIEGQLNASWSYVGRLKCTKCQPWSEWSTSFSQNSANNIHNLQEMLEESLRKPTCCLSQDLLAKLLWVVRFWVIRFNKAKLGCWIEFGCRISEKVLNYTAIFYTN